MFREATMCHLLQWRNDLERTEMLLGHRTSLFQQGTWSAPGGKMEKSETVRHCLKREVREEVGVTLLMSSAKQIATVDYYHPTPDKGHELAWRVHFFNVKEWRGKLRPLNGFDKLRWFPIHGLPYRTMAPDVVTWLPMAFMETPDRLLKAEIYYADEKLTKVSKGTFQFV